MKIKLLIILGERKISVLANDNTKELKIGYEVIDNNKDFAKQAINIVKEWPEELVDEEKNDGIHYQIMYDDDNCIRKLTGNNQVPDDFYKLINLIEDFKLDNKNYLISKQLRRMEIEAILNDSGHQM